MRPEGSSEDRVVVLDGLEEGEHVITDGADVSEGRRKSAMQTRAMRLPKACHRKQIIYLDGDDLS